MSSAETGTWALLDRSCQVVHARSGEGLASAGARLTVVEDIAWLPQFGRFLVAGGSPGRLGVATFEGTTSTFVSSQFVSGPGLAADPSDPGAFYALDVGGPLWRYTLPALTDAPTASGRYVSATATVYLWDRGEGKVTGTAHVGGDTMPLFGELSAAGGTLVIGTISPAGTPLVVEVTVSPDFSSLTGCRGSGRSDTAVGDHAPPSGPGGKPSLCQRTKAGTPNRPATGERRLFVLGWAALGVLGPLNEAASGGSEGASAHRGSAPDPAGALSLDPGHFARVGI